MEEDGIGKNLTEGLHNKDPSGIISAPKNNKRQMLELTSLNKRLCFDSKALLPDASSSNVTISEKMMQCRPD